MSIFLKEAIHEKKKDYLWTKWEVGEEKEEEEKDDI